MLQPEKQKTEMLNSVWCVVQKFISFDSPFSTSSLLASDTTRSAGERLKLKQHKFWSIASFLDYFGNFKESA